MWTVCLERRGVNTVQDYPVNLRLEGKRVVIVGGGRIAYRKLRRLMNFSCSIELISPRLDERIEPLVADERINYKGRKFIDSDLKGAFLIFALTDDRQLNRRIAKLSGNALVNVADDNELSTFTLPAVVNRGKLTLAASTGGASPALSREIKKNLGEQFGPEYAEYLKLIYDLRRVILSTVDEPGKRREILRKLGDMQLVKLFGSDRQKAIKEVKSIVGRGVGVAPSEIFQEVQR